MTTGTISSSVAGLSAARPHGLTPAALHPRLVTHHQLGKFKLRLDLIQDNTQEVLQLMSHVIVLSADVLLAEGVVSYLGYSDYFTPLSIGESASSYLPLFGAKGEGKFLGFTKMDNVPQEVTGNRRAGEQRRGE